MNRAWKAFSLKVALWLGAALAVHFLATVFLGGPPPYVVPGILILGALRVALLDRTALPVGDGKLLKRGVALMMITFAAWLVSNPGGDSKIPWITYSDEALAAARAGGRSVMIDFTSRNCPPCLDMKRKVFSQSRVAQAAEEFLPLQADLTDDSPASQALAARFHIEAFPTIVFIGPDGKERRNLRLVGYEDALRFRQRLEAAR